MGPAQRILCIAGLLTFPLLICAQERDSMAKRSLPAVIIKAFEQNRRIQDIPAAINFINKAMMERFGPGSIVHAVNTTPGVRMEERSPGSYRFNIRGSALRSPFGVRNVKVYFNDIPITDPGGHTYLNQLGYYNFNSLEIIKGPGSSIYGAGTGGVLLIESLPAYEATSFVTEYAAGSYGLRNIYGSVTVRSEKSVNRAGYQHQQSRGYRNHSELKRDVHSWNGLFRIGEKNSLKTTFLYGKLFYETPGALTKAEFGINPKSSRPGNAFFPGAEAARASITQNQFIAGASYEQRLFSELTNKSVLYGMFTDLKNPTLQNYGHSSEPHVGGRTTFKFSRAVNNSFLSFDAGGEWQEGFTSLTIHKNVSGYADSVRNHDEIHNRQSLLFTQLSWDHPGWTVTGGASLNFLRLSFQRFQPATAGKQKRSFSNEVAPRIAILKKFSQWNVYASIAKGFSPPTTSELLPTGGAVNLGLNAEEGTNYDIGVKADIGMLYLDVNAFVFSLSNTIVQRRTAGGGDFFINAGKTRQHGIETSLTYPLLHANQEIESGQIWFSHTWHQFHYRNFKQVDNDYSGNRLPGVAPHIISAGIDIAARNGLGGTFSYYYSDRIPLNDANSEYAPAYHLVGLKVGYRKWWKEILQMKLLTGVENLLDQQYSLGNDINGFGGRYYNAAAGRSFHASLIVQFLPKK